MLAVLATLAGRGPLTLVVADLHWANLRVLELLEAALARLASTPFALIATTRPGGDLPAPPRTARLTTLTLRLDPLGQEAARELLRAMLGEGTNLALVEELYDRSGGNPLFLEELAELVAEGGGTGQLPDSLRALVATRLDELAPDQRAMLDNAAVLGSSGSYGALVEFGQALGQNTARSLLDALADAGLLDVEGAWWRFRSASVREVAYHTITKADRPAAMSGWPRRWWPTPMDRSGPTSWPTTGPRRPSWPVSWAAGCAACRPTWWPRPSRPCWRRRAMTWTGCTPGPPWTRWRVRCRSATASSMAPPGVRWSSPAPRPGSSSGSSRRPKPTCNGWSRRPSPRETCTAWPKLGRCGPRSPG